MVLLLRPMSAGNHLPERPAGATAPSHPVPPAASGLNAQPRIAVLVLGRLDRARLQDAIRGRAILEPVDSVAALEQIVARSVPRVVAVIAEPYDLARTPAAPTLARLRAEYPGVALIGYCQPGHKHSAEILALAHAGVHELVFRGVDDTSLTLQQALARASQSSAAREVFRVLRPRISPEAAPIIEACVQYAWPELSSRELARALGTNIKSLVQRCRAVGLPAPGALLTWVRLMIVAYLLEAEGRSLSQIAAALGMPSGSPLRNLLKRYTGQRALEVRAHGGVNVVIEAFLRPDAFGRQSLRRARADGAEPPDQDIDVDPMEGLETSEGPADDEE